MKNRFEVRGPDRGTCAICGAHGPLTEDHVPPKGSIRIGQIQMTALWKRISADQKGERPPRYSQNGVKFRSLCRECNNVRLGARCDPSLIGLTTEVARLLSEVGPTKLILPSTFSVRARPIAVLRSVVGHILAANVGRAPTGPFELALSEFFLDPLRPPPRAFDCYYWIYPYNDQVIVDAAVLSHAVGSGNGGTYFKLLKFYPFAFFLTWERNESIRFNLQNLCDHGNLRHDAEADIAVDVSGIPHQLWPEVPVGQGAVMYGGNPRLVEPRG